jgi:hypothetical protein
MSRLLNNVPKNHVGVKSQEVMKSVDDLSRFVNGKKKLPPSKRVLKILENNNIISKMDGGKISRINKAERWTDYSYDTANKGLNLTRKGVKVYKDVKNPWSGVGAVGSGQKSKNNNWINHVKAFTQANNIPYKQAMTAAKASYRS